MKDIDVTALAFLARLDIPEDRAKQIKREIEEFAEFCEVLSGCDAAEDNTAAGFSLCNARLDEANADRVDMAEGYIAVPLTVEAGQ